MTGLKKMLIPLTIPRNPSKQDPYDPWTAAIGGGLGLIGGLFQGYNNRKINEMNIAMQRETNALNERLFRENMSYQHNERIDQDTRNWKHAIDMFNMENAYNSPDQQVKRMIAAGLNPAALAGASAAGNSSMGSPSMGSAVGVGTPQLDSPRAQMYDVGAQNIFGNMVTLTQAIGNLAGASKDNQSAKEIETLLAAKLRGLNLSNEQLELQKNLLFEFGSKTKQAEYELLTAKASLAASQIALNDEMTNTEKEKQFNLIADSLEKDSKRLLNKKELKVFDEKFDVWKREVNSRIMVNKSVYSLNQSGVRLNNQRVVTEQALQSLYHSQEKLNNSIKQLNENQNAYEQQTIQTRILQQMEETSQAELFTEEEKQNLDYAKAQAEIAMYENDMKKYNWWINQYYRWVDNTCKVVKTGVDAVKGTKSMPYTFDNVPHESYEEYEEFPRRVLGHDGNPEELKRTTKRKRYR